MRRKVFTRSRQLWEISYDDKGKIPETDSARSYSMKAIPLIRAVQLEPYLTFLDQIGAPSHQLLEASHIQGSILSNPEQFLPEYQVWDFIERAGKKNGSVIEFGLQTGLAGNFDFLLGLMQGALTPYDALHRFCLLTRLHSSQSTFWLSPQNQEIWFCRQGIQDIAIGQQAVEGYTLMLMINLVRHATGLKDWQPTKLTLQMSKNPTVAKFKPLENVDIQYRKQVTAVAINTNLLSLPQPTPASPHPFNPLDSSAPATDFVGSLRQILEPQLHQHYPTLSFIAQITGMSPRSLQRRLQQAGLTYTKLINQIQFEQAKSLVNDSELKFKDIANQLGYSTQAHFTRAFKRWTGVTPQSFRQLSLESISQSQ